ncbi:MAG: hypothetical protein EOO51_09445 [Flavobacterium sp.]|nr:MAG: hypothetical protein EOO51_09445 [Flavobacterium sp.]
MKKLLVAAAFLIVSCNYFKPERKPEAIARVNESYLYRDDLADLVPPGTSKEDSLVIVKSFIDRWASQKLLIDAAEVNLKDDRKAGFDKLVRQYKTDLYTRAYIEEVVKRSVDTAISAAELESYYKENKENFRTTGMLVRLRYILLQQDNPKYETIKSHFFDFRKSDKKFWETYALQFKKFALNDTVWVDMGQVYTKLPFINPDNRDQYVSSGKSIQYPSGKDIYLAKITGVIDKNQVAPYEYLKPTLREMIINRRKVDLIKKFEKEITDDAIKDNKYEIYK